jgi:ADP-ribose pyrophosphatase YjhB (NUDIX family)
MFCLQCGQELTQKIFEEKKRFVCPICGWVYYQQLKVSSAVIIEKNNQILLLKRAYDPWKDFWYLPAGYVEHDEDPKMAGVREVSEEIGIKIQIQENGLFNYYYFDDDPRGNGLLLVYVSNVLKWSIAPSNEITDYQFYSANHLPKNLCGAGHRSAILDWVKLKNE